MAYPMARSPCGQSSQSSSSTITCSAAGCTASTAPKAATRSHDWRCTLGFTRSVAWFGQASGGVGACFVTKVARPAYASAAAAKTRCFSGGSWLFTTTTSVDAASGLARCAGSCSRIACSVRSR